MGYGYSPNNSHFTGKKRNPCRSKKKRVARKKQKLHVNRYAKNPC